MKLLEGTIYTQDIHRLAKALEARGLIVHEVIYDGRKVLDSGIRSGIACLYDLINRVKIRTVIADDLVGTIMDTLGSFGDCKLFILPGEQFCTA